MNVLDLFSGIGGFSLGLERAGMRTVAFCERDEFCRAVLRKHWPGVPCFEDIRAIDADGLGRLGRVDLVCGGFPCQPFSVAGKRAAQNDDRYLWPEMRKVIALARPSWVIGENVAGIISVALDTVLADLENDGYAPRAFVIPACAAGARHQRDRVWILAHADSSELRHQPRRSNGPSGEGAAKPGNDGQVGLAADTDGPGPQVRFMQPGVPGEARCDDDGQDPSVDDGWLAEPAVVRRLHGIPGRMDRIRALGNAVYPPLVEEIGRAILRSQP
jgi:DNA (cytosine-5)-methyltransferase 1